MSSQEKTIEELEALPDSEIDYSDIPVTDKEFWKTAKVIMPYPTRSVSLRIDQEVLEWFKAQGKGYHSRISAVLREYVKAKKAQATRISEKIS